MAVSALAWNVNDKLGDPDMAAKMLDEVERLDPDIAFFSEACDSDIADQFSTIHAVEQRLGDAGYEFLRTPNNDRDDRTDRHDILAVSRVGELAVVGLGGRVGVYMSAADQETHENIAVVAYHGDDRSGESRRHMAGKAIELLREADENGLWAVMGDLNSMKPDARRTRIMKAGLSPILNKPVLTRFPYEEPRRGASLLSMKRWGNFLRRLDQMTDDGVFEMYAEAGLSPSGSTAATFQGTLPGLKNPSPLFQLDHVLAGPRVEMSEYTVHPTELSDHLPVTATLSVRS